MRPRAALYTAGRGFLPCAQNARRVGWRVVTMAQDEPEDAVFAGPRLTSLVRRMEAGEFEAIVANSGAGRILVLQPTQALQGNPQ